MQVQSSFTASPNSAKREKIVAYACSGLRYLAAAVTAAHHGWQQKCRLRHDERELRAMSDQSLHDLGIGRCEIIDSVTHGRSNRENA